MHRIIPGRTNYLHFHCYNGIGLTLAIAESWQTSYQGPAEGDITDGKTGNKTSLHGVIRVQKFNGYAVGMAICCKDDAGGTKEQGRIEADKRLAAELTINPTDPYLLRPGRLFFIDMKSLTSFVDALRSTELADWSDKNKHRQYMRAFNHQDLKPTPACCVAMPAPLKEPGNITEALAKALNAIKGTEPKQSWSVPLFRPFFLRAPKPEPLTHRVMSRQVNPPTNTMGSRVASIDPDKND